MEAPKGWGDDPDISSSISDRVLYLPIANKDIDKVKIIDNKEPVVDLRSPRIIHMSELDNQYSANYEGYSKGRSGLLNRLNKMLEILPADIGIAFFECWRPLSKQKQYFDSKLREIIKERSFNLYDAYEETAKHVSPFIDNIPPHSTGAAIDMTLFRLSPIDGTPLELLDMGKFDVIFGHNDQQETFSLNTTIVQRTNRLLLLRTAVEASFVNYGYEWWHYSYGDKAWAYLEHEPNAIYGPISSPSFAGVNSNVSLAPSAIEKVDFYPLALTKEQYLAEVAQSLNL